MCKKLMKKHHNGMKFWQKGKLPQACEVYWFSSFFSLLFLIQGNSHEACSSATMAVRQGTRSSPGKGDCGKGCGKGQPMWLKGAAYEGKIDGSPNTLSVKKVVFHLQ